MKKLGVIINPIAGLGRGSRLLKCLVLGLRETEFEPIMEVTTKPGDAREIASNAHQFDALVCIGGDGTVNEVINGLSNIDFRTPLGIIPVGSGNVIAKELKLKSGIKRFTDLLKTGKTKLLDVGKVNFDSDSLKPRLFISMAGIGFDAEVTRQHHLKRKGADFYPHTTSYIPLALKSVLTYKIPRITLEIDGKLITEEASFIQVANARSYGGPLVFAPKAKPDDERLDIIWFRAKSSREFLRYYLDAFWTFWTDLATKTPSAYYLRGKEIRLSSPQSVPIQVDGDFCGYLPVHIQIIPRVISVFADTSVN